MQKHTSVDPSEGLTTPKKKHTMTAVVENKPGVLNRIVSAFRRRSFNIESVAVGRTEHPDFPGRDLSRLTMVVMSDDGAGEQVVEQVRKQLFKLVDVLTISDISDNDIVARELALVKVKAPSSSRGEVIRVQVIHPGVARADVRVMPPSRAEIIQLADIFRANIVDVAPDALILEVTGDEDKIEALLELLRPFGILDVARSGRVALARG